MNKILDNLISSTNKAIGRSKQLNNLAEKILNVFAFNATAKTVQYKWVKECIGGCVGGFRSCWWCQYYLYQGGSHPVWKKVVPSNCGVPFYDFC